MAAPTVTVNAPPPANYPAPGILRPAANIKWTGGTGPFNVLHEWDTVGTFDSANLIQDSNLAVTSPDVGVPPSDMGPAGTVWYYRATVTDSIPLATTTSPITLNWYDPVAVRRYLYHLGNVGVAFYPIDTAVLAEAGDGQTINRRRYLYHLGNVGVGFYPTDTAVLAEAVDGDVREFDRFLYQLANIDATTPVPHIWFLYPTYGREGWEFAIVGYGFGDTQATFAGIAEINGLGAGITSWTLVAAVGTGMEIDPTANLANPVHQLILAVVPVGAESGLVIVTTDGP